MRKFGAAVISLVIVAVVLALVGTASGLSQKGPQNYYLALGDSIAYGFDPGKAARPSPSSGPTGASGRRQPTWPSPAMSSSWRPEESRTSHASAK